MLLTNSKNASSSFGLKASAKAFKILSSGIYKHKIRAVVREISCNAADSHVMAGCPTLPFSVHAPTQFEPWFSVTDYGVGLSDDDVMHLYTTYFESNKKSDDGDDEFSDLFTGGMGLGSKSPFAYTDQYMVHSWHGGYKRSYNAYILPSGKPDIRKLSEKKLVGDEAGRTGFEVYVPADNKDIRTWSTEIQSVLSMFTVTPDVSGLSDPIVNCIADVDHYAPFGRNSYCRIIAWMGNVDYPISRDDRRDIMQRYGSSKETISALDNIIDVVSGFIIKFDLNSFDFQPSREEIDFTDKTVAAIGKELEHIASDYLERVQQDIDASTAVSVTQVIDGQCANLIRRVNSITRHGVPVHDASFLNFADVEQFASQSDEHMDFVVNHVAARSTAWHSRKTTRNTVYGLEKVDYADPNSDVKLVQHQPSHTKWLFMSGVHVHDVSFHVGHYTGVATAQLDSSKGYTSRDILQIVQTKKNAAIAAEFIALLDPRFACVIASSELTEFKPPVTRRTGKVTKYHVATYAARADNRCADVKFSDLSMYAADLAEYVEEQTCPVFYVVANRNEEWAVLQGIKLEFAFVKRLLAYFNTSMHVMFVSASRETTAKRAGAVEFDTVVRRHLQTISPVLQQMLNAHAYRQSNYNARTFSNAEVAIAALTATGKYADEIAVYEQLSEYQQDEWQLDDDLLVNSIKYSAISFIVHNSNAVKPANINEKLNKTLDQHCYNSNYYRSSGAQSMLATLIETKYPLVDQYANSERIPEHARKHVFAYINMVNNILENEE